MHSGTNAKPMPAFRASRGDRMCRRTPPTEIVPRDRMSTVKAEEQFELALAFEPGHTQDFSFSYIEGGAAQPPAGRQLSHGEQRARARFWRPHWVKLLEASSQHGRDKAVHLSVVAWPRPPRPDHDDRCGARLHAVAHVFYL